MMIVFSSCSKDFIEKSDPNSIPSHQFMKSEGDALLALNGVYQALRSSNSLGENSSLFSEQRSDNTGTNDNQSNAGEPFQFPDFSLVPSNSYLKSHWSAMYEMITRANYVLTYIDGVAFSNAETKEQYKAEAKALRAMTYFHLVRKWGDIPMVTRTLVSADESAALTFREKEARVYEQIISDLKEAAESTLPDIQPAASRGRISKTYVNALLGQVYLTMALTQDQSRRTENLQLAKTWLTSAYEKRQFANIRDIAYADVFNVDLEGNNKEAIFVIEYKQGDLNYYSSIAYNNQARGETINSQRPNTGAGGRVTLDLVKDYETGDARKDYSVKYAAATAVQDWFITKFRDASTTAGVNGYGGNDWILMRFADIILMLAEVNNYLGDEATAIQYLDMIRERAGLPSYAVAKLDPIYSTKYPDLKLAILHERRVELAFEGHRLYDLLRTFTAQELVNYFKLKQQADYGNPRLSNISVKDRYYPIPLDEYKLNPEKMYQNPGY
jgi:hypothetical protein